SDVELVRPISEATLTSAGYPMLYRRPDAVDDRLPVHMEWHAVSRSLLGLPSAQFPAADYVSSFCVWEPAVLQALVDRIETISGRDWMDVVTAQRSFSEWTLYGVYAENFVEHSRSAMTDESLCHSYWDQTPLLPAEAPGFMERIGPRDVAILIQSKSR